MALRGGVGQHGPQGLAPEVLAARKQPLLGRVEVVEPVVGPAMDSNSGRGLLEYLVEGFALPHPLLGVGQHLGLQGFVLPAGLDLPGDDVGEHADAYGLTVFAVGLVGQVVVVGLGRGVAGGFDGEQQFLAEVGFAGLVHLIQQGNEALRHRFGQSLGHGAAGQLAAGELALVGGVEVVVAVLRAAQDADEGRRFLEHLVEGGALLGLALGAGQHLGLPGGGLLPGVHLLRYVVGKYAHARYLTVFAVRLVGEVKVAGVRRLVAGGGQDVGCFAAKVRVAGLEHRIEQRDKALFHGFGYGLGQGAAPQGAAGKELPVGHVVEVEAVPRAAQQRNRGRGLFEEVVRRFALLGLALGGGQHLGLQGFILPAGLDLLRHLKAKYHDAIDAALFVVARLLHVGPVAVLEHAVVGARQARVQLMLPVGFAGSEYPLNGVVRGVVG